MPSTASEIPSLTAEQIRRAALNLPAEDREELADALAASLSVDPELEEQWAEEIERRHQAYLAGEMEAYPAKQVIAEARSRLRR